MNYEQALEYIHGIYGRGSKLGLTRITELLNRLGNPQKSLKFVHIAGTNGKGSTAAMTSHILRAAGYQTGLYISPFINRFNERIQLNNVPIPDDELAELTTYVHDFAESMENPPTEFELITAIAFEYYKRSKCDIVVLEVGLGGTLDSTNVIDTPELAIITPIGLDHTHVLGSTIKQVASAKAGIIKEGGDVVVYGHDRDAEEVFETACREKHASLKKTDFSSLKLLSRSIDGQHFAFAEYSDLFLTLIGSYQLYNAAVVLTGIEALRKKGWKISEDAVKEGLSGTRWPGRFEVLSRKPLFIVDGGHNPHGVRGTADTLKAFFPEQKFVFLMGVMADKNVDEILDILTPLAKRFYTAAPDNQRAMSASELAARIESRGVKATACASVEKGVEAALSENTDGSIICAIGSLYMAGTVRMCFGRN